MKLIVFDQWDKLVAMFKSMAGKAATEKSQYAFNRVMPVEGRALLMDRAMNNISVSGGSVVLQVPDIIPGKARDFLVRVTAEADTDIAFTGAEAFEGDNDDVLMPPNAGETVIYFFTETAPDVFLVARRPVERIET